MVQITMNKVNMAKLINAKIFMTKPTMHKLIMAKNQNA